MAAPTTQPHTSPTSVLWSRIQDSRFYHTTSSSVTLYEIGDNVTKHLNAQTTGNATKIALNRSQFAQIVARIDNIQLLRYLCVVENDYMHNKDALPFIHSTNI
jgi:hypothetical protein